MHDRPEEQRISDLAVEVLRLIQGRPADGGANYPDNVPAHGQQDQEDVDAEDESGAS